jgi:uncharacterized Fe-S cluster-containing radical SAM superfamily protein
MEDKFCSFFWTHLCLRSNQEIAPCCRFIDLNLPTFQKNPITNFNSDFFKNLRKKNLNNEKIDGCLKCDLHQSKQNTLREFANREFPIKKETCTEEASPNNIQFLEINLGSKCNAACIMCNAHISSTWEIVNKQLDWPVDKKKDSEEIDYSFLSQLTSLKEIKFIGGEPLLYQKEIITILDYLPTKILKEISLLIVTNASIPFNKEFLEKINCIKKLNLYISIDGFGQLNEFIRYPIKWNTFSKNVNDFIKLPIYYKNIEISFHTTVSLYNIFRLHEIEIWIRQHMDPTIPLNLTMTPLIEPHIMNIKYLTPEQCSRALHQLKPNSTCEFKLRKILEEIQLTPVSEEDQITRKLKFIQYTKSMESVRKISFLEIIPEASDLF